jgi:hypothetical protein
MKPERIMDAASCRPSDSIRSEGYGATLRWPRLLFSLSVLALLGAGFNGIYARPAPTLSEWAVFSCLLMLIFLETLAAGWYRGQRKIPGDLRRKPVRSEQRFSNAAQAEAAAALPAKSKRAKGR